MADSDSTAPPPAAELGAISLGAFMAAECERIRRHRKVKKYERRLNKKIGVDLHLSEFQEKSRRRSIKSLRGHLRQATRERSLAQDESKKRLNALLRFQHVTITSVKEMEKVKYVLDHNEWKVTLWIAVVEQFAQIRSIVLSAILPVTYQGLPRDAMP
ncbi:hypothetical protein HS088_TW09G00101 [Tripterygium wilfordii]|uniref:Uncharacterized protein n=1 Tax=Tripterygium wilfordii TaxID=458696 RepID=A0A7J7D6W1_TRIWF|nr:uncharacterized protein LOC120005323 [Tripterygium wilfordii]KAF5742062.1 hypothetical protein HS088_TW09G00101 [Tripterygium wilfordii]